MLNDHFLNNCSATTVLKKSCSINPCICNHCSVLGGHLIVIQALRNQLTLTTVPASCNHMTKHFWPSLFGFWQAESTGKLAEGCKLWSSDVSLNDQGKKKKKDCKVRYSHMVPRLMNTKINLFSGPYCGCKLRTNSSVRFAALATFGKIIWDKSSCAYHVHTQTILTILDLKMSNNPDKWLYWLGTLRRWTISKSVLTPGPWHSPTYNFRYLWWICTNTGTWLKNIENVFQ